VSEAPAELAGDTSANEPGIGRRFTRFFLLLLFFVVAGPPVGSVVLFTIVAVSQIQTVADAVQALAAPFIGLLLSPLSYLFGALPAAIGGAFVAGWQAFRGRISATGAVAIGVALGLGAAVFTHGAGEAASKGVDWPAAISMFLTVMLPALICWYPMRNRFYPPFGSGQDTA
jgi:hypothetical protein